MKRIIAALFLAGAASVPWTSAATQPFAPWPKPANVWSTPTRAPPTLPAALYFLAPKPVWRAPPYKMYAQALSDEIRAAYPEVQSANIHAKVPNTNMYTYVAGLPFRVGSVEDPKDDLYVINDGVTIIDPRRGKTDRDGPKYEIAMPLKAATGQDIGQLVLVFNLSAYHGASLDTDAYTDAIKIRNALATRIRDNNQLFERAN